MKLYFNRNLIFTSRYESSFFSSSFLLSSFFLLASRQGCIFYLLFFHTHIYMTAKFLTAKQMNVFVNSIFPDLSLRTVRFRKKLIFWLVHPRKDQDKRRDSNRRPNGCRACALPLDHGDPLKLRESLFNQLLILSFTESSII